MGLASFSFFLKGNYGKVPQNIDKIDEHTLILPCFLGEFLLFLFYPSHEQNFANNAELMRFLGHAAESENEKKRDKRREEKKKERQEKEKRKKREKEDKQKSTKEPGSHHCSWLVSQFGLLRNPYNRGTCSSTRAFQKPKKEAGSSSNHLPFRSEFLNLRGV